MSLLTKYVVRESLQSDVMMSNVYPFLMGMAALKHEKIAAFPDIPEPEHHVLVAHCGYFGLLPQRMASEWKLRPKVLAIVDDNATAIDARLPVGPVTMAKLDPKLELLQVIPAGAGGLRQLPRLRLPQRRHRAGARRPGAHGPALLAPPDLHHR